MLEKMVNFDLSLGQNFQSRAQRTWRNDKDLWCSLALEIRSVVTISLVTLTRAIEMAFKASWHIIGKSTMECATAKSLHQNYQPAYEVHLGSEYHGVVDILPSLFLGEPLDESAAIPSQVETNYFLIIISWSR